MIAPAVYAVEMERAQRKPPENLTAYDYHLRALRRFRASLNENREALKLLRDGSGAIPAGNGGGMGAAPRPPSGGGNTALAARPILASANPMPAPPAPITSTSVSSFSMFSAFMLPPNTLSAPWGRRPGRRPIPLK